MHEGLTKTEPSRNRLGLQIPHGDTTGAHAVCLCILTNIRSNSNRPSRANDRVHAPCQPNEDCSMVVQQTVAPARVFAQRERFCQSRGANQRHTTRSHGAQIPKKQPMASVHEEAVITVGPTTPAADPCASLPRVEIGGQL